MDHYWAKFCHVLGLFLVQVNLHLSIVRVNYGASNCPRQVELASSTLLEYAPGLWPRTNAPGTQQVWKTYAPPRLVHLRFRQKRRAHWLCIPPYLSPANWLTTPSACGLDHTQPETHRVQRPSALLLLLEVRSAKRPHCKDRPWPSTAPRGDHCPEG